jgi:hypothetical protein
MFESALRSREHELSAYAFENIALWQSLYAVLWTHLAGNLCVFLRDELGIFLYLPPLGASVSPQALEQAYMLMEEANRGSRASRIENIEESDRPFFEQAGFECTSKTGEYLCSRSALSHLRGNAYKSKRWSVNVFLRGGTPVFGHMTPDDAAECLSLYDRWRSALLQKPRDAVFTGMLEDMRRCLPAAIAQIGVSAWTGRCVRAEGRLLAYTLGYPVSERTFCVFYEIADPDAAGSAQYIFQRFCADLASYETINIMDDCGLPHLTRVKQSYRPVRCAPNYTATRK